MKYKFLFLLILSGLIWQGCQTENTVIWQIGAADNSCAEFALAPDNYANFIENDFGWEDKFYLIGASKEKSDFPYVLPGPLDQWGGTWSTSGWRTHTLNILFGIEKLPKNKEWKLVVDLYEINSEEAPVFKITVNQKQFNFHLPKGSGINTLEDNSGEGQEYLIEHPIPSDLLKTGGNQISLTTIQGSWLLFDQVRIEGPANVQLSDNRDVFLRNVKSAEYELKTEYGNFQPLLVDVEHINGLPKLKVLVDGDQIFEETIEKGRYIFEAPMPAVSKKVKSKYEISLNGEIIQSGKIVREPKKIQSAAGYVNTKIGTAHSRWMIAPGPWMPFSMVKLSPDNQDAGWQAGYDPIFETVGTFSHIHEWTMAGLGFMPTNGELQIQMGDQYNPDEGYRSRLNKETEEAPLGYYKADLTDYDITAELTSTTRCGFQRYTFPKNREGSRVMIDLKIPAEYSYMIKSFKIEKIGENQVVGYSRHHSPNTWAGGINQDYIVHFVAEFDQPIKEIGFWTEDGIVRGKTRLEMETVEDAGAFVEFETKENNVVQVRTGLSYVSIENAIENLSTEISDPFQWDFEAVRENHVAVWNDLLERVKIKSNDAREKMRFYNNMYRSLCSRNIFSDVNGQWIGPDENLQELENPDSPALGCDAFWNTFWNLNQFWNLVTPEWSNRWVNSQLAMYKTNGWLAKGPAGMEYIPVMVAEHEIPLIVGAYQMGIRDYDVELAYEACKKMQTTKASNVGGGFAGNRDLEHYLKYKYVPYDKGRFSNTLEYSFDDWTVSQFAKALGKENDYKTFLKRGYYWKNVIDRESGYARLKDSRGKWMTDFDPYKSGANHHYVEGNAWQLTYFVPQDVPALAQAIGKERFIERLNWGFAESDITRYNGKNDQYWNYPVIQGNQQSMHFSYLFNWVGKPWLTQKWSRSIIDRYYGYGLANAYLGDEDQGQMSAWFIMVSLGLFQTDGGCRVQPVYEIGSPLFEKVEINLGQQYNRGEKFTIEAKNVSRKNIYVQSAMLNGKVLNTFSFPASELLKGGELLLEMGSEPNRLWGVE
ncbi:GH92 family glycosyl hydrolase [uncultured Draconibacterium sp.]|uniref:GH92 family glycosyl hydrolase n=1 Tax=uncultured Draconibacterium sp. TaxID=1573823 RepID=UPI0025CE4F53|nr:GH92 family glycosyl hydrolase [uncultured Draconibacterium sp.]